MGTDALESGGQNLFPLVLPVPSSCRLFPSALEPEMAPTEKRKGEGRHVGRWPRNAVPGSSSCVTVNNPLNLSEPQCLHCLFSQSFFSFSSSCPRGGSAPGMVLSQVEACHCVSRDYFQPGKRPRSFSQLFQERSVQLVIRGSRDSRSCRMREGLEAQVSLPFSPFSHFQKASVYLGSSLATKLSS